MNDATLLLGDCIDKLRELPAQSVDCIITDPPFFLKLDHFKTRKWFAKSFADLNMVEPFYIAAFEEMKRVLKPTGRVFVFCDGQSYPIFWAHLFSFTKSARPLIWDKITAYNGYGWRHQHELIIFAEMPEATPIKTGDGDILRFPAVKADTRVHPAQKPTNLIEVLITKTTTEGETVCDPFMGGGSTGIAAMRLKRKFIGIELDERYYATAKKRINEQEVRP